MKYKHIWWAVATNNTVRMICWAALAVHFEKWWIALFACFTMASVKTKRDDDKTAEMDRGNDDIW